MLITSFNEIVALFTMFVFGGLIFSAPSLRYRRYRHWSDKVYYSIGLLFLTPPLVKLFYTGLML